MHNAQCRVEKLKLLHSRYNPQAEAERYIASLSLDDNIRFFVMIEPGLGYITAPLRKKLPGAKIIALHVEQPAGELAENAPDSKWYPETGIAVQDFLETEIQDSKATEIRLLEWRPALSVYGDAYLVLVKETVEFIKRSDANTRTLKTFGRSWFRNFFRNLDIVKNILSPIQTRLAAPLPMIVTGAGPGLEEILPLIREKRDRLFILAAASSVAVLANENIIPNLVISTDGTAWAKLHLYELFRTKQTVGTQQSPLSPPNGPYLLAAALTAALPSQCETLPVLPICDGSLWQTLILNELKIPYITLPQRGTVSASALDLAFALSDCEIYIAGIDLANKDIRSHARPYSLDRLMEEKAERTNPVYSQVYKRSSLLKEGGTYGVYASWFKKQLAVYPKRLFSLGNNNPVFSSLETALERGIGYNPTAPCGEKTRINFKTIALESDYSEKAYTVLKNALKNPVHSEALQNELKSLHLLSASSNEPSIDELLDCLASFRRGGNDA